MSNELRLKAEHYLRHEVALSLGLVPEAVHVDAVENGIATVRLGEACASCPATLPLLIAQIEAALKPQIPEVEIVEVIG